MKNEELNNELFKAIKEGNLENVKKTLEQGADVNAQDDKRNPALVISISKSKYEIVKLLIEKGADINIKDEDSDTSLIKASRHGYTDITHLLIINGADVNAKSIDGSTALMEASRNSFINYDTYLTIVKLLIQNGADVNVKSNDEGLTALIFSSKSGHIEIVKLLIEKGADVNARDEFGNTVLMAATDYYENNIEIIKLLIEKGADVNAKTNLGVTVLMKTAQKGKMDILNLLCENGADVNAKDKYGKTAFDNAETSKLKKILRNFESNDTNQKEKIKDNNMILINFTGRMKYKTLKLNFYKLIGLNLLLYSGDTIADEDVIISSLTDNKIGKDAKLDIDINETIGDFCNRVYKVFGIKMAIAERFSNTLLYNNVLFGEEIYFNINDEGKIFCPYSGEEITAYDGNIKIELELNWAYRSFPVNKEILITKQMNDKIKLNYPNEEDYYDIDDTLNDTYNITGYILESPFANKSFKMTNQNAEEFWIFKNFKKLNLFDLVPGKYLLDGYFVSGANYFSQDDEIIINFAKYDFEDIEGREEIISILDEKTNACINFNTYTILDNSDSWEFFGTATPVG
jgi:ankyrin repeat protein